MFTFLHAADLHLDTPVADVAGKGLRSAPLETLRDASILAWDSVVESAIGHGVSFVILSGGIYDGPERGLRGQLCLRDGFNRLDAAGIRSFVVLGAHDAAAPTWLALGDWPASTHVFAPPGATGDPAEAVTFEAGRTEVTVHGVSNAATDLPDGVVDRFPTARGTGFHIGVLHAGHGRGAPATTDLQARAIDYWALGGSHAHTVHAEEPWVVEPGSPQGRSFAPAEQGPHGALLVTVDGDQVGPPRLDPLDTIRFATTTVDITDVGSITDLVDQIQAACDPDLDEGRSVMLKATLTGSGPLHSELADDDAAARLVKAVNSSHGSGPFIWLDRLWVRTRPTLDLDEARHGTDFLSDLLATVDGPTGDHDWLVGLPRLPNDVARLLDQPISPDDPDIVSRAVDVALDEFTGGQS